MLETTLLDLQNSLKASGILISFSGRLSQGIIEELGDAIKNHLEAEETPKNEIHSVFAIFIEQTHNIQNYIAKKMGQACYDRFSSSGIVAIGKHRDGYFVCAGNLIEKQDADQLAAKIDALKQLEKDELKRLYKEQLRKELSPGATGAGVGLIDIARKASRPLEYSLLQVDNQFLYFTINVTI